MATTVIRAGMRAKAQQVELTIDRLALGGRGVARLASGEVVFVPKVAPGERVRVELDRRKKPLEAQVVRVLEPSVDRVEPQCPLFDRCGGCDFLHLTTDAQRQLREGLLRESLSKSPKSPAMAAEIAGMVVNHVEAAPRGSRTRARLSAKRIGGHVRVGYHQMGSQLLVETTHCPALDVRLDTVLGLLSRWLHGAQGEGELSLALGAGGLPVVSIVWSGEVPGSVFHAAEMAVQSGTVAGVEVWLEGAKSPAIIGDVIPRIPVGDNEELLLPARGFAQASDVGNQVLVDLVARRANGTNLRVLELFSGSGNLSIGLAKDAASLTCVELDGPAVLAARANVARLGKSSCRTKIIEADADTYVPSGDRPDVVVLDPPRTGAKGAVARLLSLKPKRIVYVSCDAPTLGRDLGLLLPGFRVTSVDMLDLFPDTHHAEVVVVLERRTA